MAGKTIADSRVTLGRMFNAGARQNQHKAQRSRDTE